MPRNRTERRLDHVKKVYASRPGVIGVTVATVTGGTLGTAIYRDPGSVDELFVYDSIVDLGPETNPHVPWIAREAARALKLRARNRQEPDGRPPADVRVFPRTWPRIRDWMTATEPDTARLRWNDAANRAHEWHVDLQQRQAEGGPPVAGDLVATLSGGWTLQDLRSFDELEEEGVAMKHCSGNYWPRVRRGDSRVLSIRDPEGWPHVTLELTHPGKRSPPGFGHLTKIEQVFGKANSFPKEVYHPYVVEALALLVPRDQWGIDGEIFLPGGRDRFWATAIHDEDRLSQYVGYFSDEEAGLQAVFDASEGNLDDDWIRPARGHLHPTQAFEGSTPGGSMVEGELVVSAMIPYAEIERVDGNAQESYAEVVFSDPVLREHPAVHDLLWDGWSRGSATAHEAFKKSVEEECDQLVLDEDGWTLQWRWPMADRARLLRDFAVTWDEAAGKPRRSRAEQRVAEATRVVNESFEQWAEALTTESVEALGALLDQYDEDEGS